MARNGISYPPWEFDILTSFVLISIHLRDLNHAGHKDHFLNSLFFLALFVAAWSMEIFTFSFLVKHRLFMRSFDVIQYC